MRKYILLVVVLLNTALFAQNTGIKSDLPTIIPPSPSVAALMKFEEVPVNNYTGIPDISIPLFSSSTLSKDLNFNLALKYHSGVGVEDRASEVGLGWAIFGGGTISRTVRGLPDEIYETSNLNKMKIGIHHNTNSINKNNYYFFVENLANPTQDFYKPFNSMSTQDKLIGNEFLWEAANNNKYDTEHDLWQFNFMGFSGRFYIKKNLQTNLLEIEPLDDYRVKIEYNYETINSKPFIPKSITIFDEKGFKYIFEIKEYSENKSASLSTFYNDNNYNTTQNIDADKIFISSLHLTKVFDCNNNLIIDFVFNSNTYIESTTNTMLSRSSIDIAEMSNNNKCFSYPPLESMLNSTTKVNSKKINYIDIIGISKIYFDYSLGRSDSNINLQNQTAFLNGLIIKDYKSNTVKKFNFLYEYINSGVYNRMFLNKIQELGTNNEVIDKNVFSYKSNVYDNNIFSVNKDFWGFYNLIRTCINNTSSHKNVSPEYCTTDLLEKIIYPTRGTTILEFEANSYSFIGNQEITDFQFNGQNCNLSVGSNFMIFNNSNQNTFLPINISSYKKVLFTPSIIINDLANATQSFGLFKYVDNNWQPVNTSMNCFDSQCCIEFFPESNVQYAIRYNNLDLNYTNGQSLNLEYFNYNGNQFFQGGGNRIKTIKYFEQVPENSNSTLGLVKQKKYFYNKSSQTLKSSGSLVFSQPLFKYTDGFMWNYQFNPFSSVGCNTNRNIQTYEVETSSNNLVASKTSGSDVGYKEVAVLEEGLGKKYFEYLSPIDYPEENLSFGKPFLPTKNFDYKRGLLLKEITYNGTDKVLNETLLNYEFVNYEKHTGTRFVNPVMTCYTGSLFKKYSDYVLLLSEVCAQCQPNYSLSTDVFCGLPLDVNSPKIKPNPIYEAYGWAKLASKTTKNYYYPNGGNTPNIVTSNETFTYNPINKQIASQTVNNSVGETLTTNYFYHTGNSPFSQNRISEIHRIETKRGSELLSESKINYSNTFAGNQSFLPSTIEVKKGNSPSEIRIKNNVYDEFGHVLEVQQESGMKISYIYGYNKTQSVAKLENIAYSAIPNALITAIQTATNNTAGTEAQVIAALNALRTSTDVNLKNAMITTITYKPLIGVSTVTDPKGDKQTYHYDSFNRLEFVKDRNGNILSENKYHYKN